MKQKNGKMKSRLLLLLALLLMVPVGVFAQNITVKGTVTDSQGETVIGATVVEKGNTSGGRSCHSLLNQLFRASPKCKKN